MAGRVLHLSVLPVLGKPTGSRPCFTSSSLFDRRLLKGNPNPSREQHQEERGSQKKEGDLPRRQVLAIHPESELVSISKYVGRLRMVTGSLTASTSEATRNSFRPASNYSS
jgi:hypothetical protein